MPVRIRLARHGAPRKPFYRIVVADSRCPRDGRHIERVGTYNPIPYADGLKEVRINSERIRYWMACGAQPTSKVEWLLGKAGILPPQPRWIFEKTGTHEPPKDEDDLEEDDAGAADADTAAKEDAPKE